MRKIVFCYLNSNLFTRFVASLTLPLLAALPALPVHAAAPAWKPTDNVEIIAGSAVGGGVDTLARQMQKVMQNERLVGTPIIVANKPGAGGDIALSYLAQQKGKGNYVLVSSNTLLTSHITGISNQNYTDFVPLAIMVRDYVSFVTKADSSITSGKILLQRLKNDPASVSFGIASALGNINHVAIGVVARAAGIDPKKLKVVVFPSASAGMTAGLGGHVHVVVSSPSIAASHVGAGKIRVLAVTSSVRLPGVLAEAPTWKGSGIDMVLGNWRGVIGPPGMNESQIAFWDQVFSRVARNDEWNGWLSNALLENGYIDSKGSATYIKSQYAELRRALADLGFAKQ